MSEELTERYLRRKFPNAPESFIKRNISRGSRTSDQSQCLDRKEVCETQRDEEVGTQYRLRSVKIEYFCSHGQQLDPSDNASYAACKPIADAIVNLGIASNDKDFTTKAAQRMDNNKTNI